MKKTHFLVFLLLGFLGGCSVQQFFYYPNRNLYVDPDRTGLPYEIVHYPSANGRILYGVYFPAVGPPKGIIVHFHGNYGNVSNHFPLALFLVRRGFDVLSFDYEGYGASEGHPTPEHLLEDGVASVHYAQGRDKTLNVGVFGQSLGGSTAIQVAAREPLVKAAVIEAAFSGHRAMSRAVLKRSAWLWPFYPFAPFFLSTHYDAIDVVDKIAPRPIFFIHGDADTIVPVDMSKKLFAAAKEPKELWIVPGANHLEAHKRAPVDYENRITTFFATNLGSGPILRQGDEKLDLTPAVK
jgi:fermentation-respiration switch protein FrsA (DUF1100 family)